MDNTSRPRVLIDREILIILFPLQTIKKTVVPPVRLPTVQLTNLKPNQTSGTFWYTTNDEKLMNEIDFSAFDEAFKLNPVNTKKGNVMVKNDLPINRGPQLKSLMEHTR